jgi:hypothetical protein
MPDLNSFTAFVEATSLTKLSPAGCILDKYWERSQYVCKALANTLRWLGVGLQSGVLYFTVLNFNNVGELLEYISIILVTIIFDHLNPKLCLEDTYKFASHPQPLDTFSAGLAYTLPLSRPSTSCPGNEQALGLMSSPGFLSKKLFGLKIKLTASVGINGKSSALGKCVNPNVCQSTTSVFSMFFDE